MELSTVEAWGERELAELHALYRGEWWCRERTLDETRAVVAGSTVALGLREGPAEGGGPLVAFARALSDRAFKALVFDVIVRPDRRGRGLGDELVERLLAHPAVAAARTIELYCLSDMAPFYRRFGFTEDVGGVLLMRRSDPRRRG